jgi:hypothetical protein
MQTARLKLFGLLALLVIFTFAEVGFTEEKAPESTPKKGQNKAAGTKKTSPSVQAIEMLAVADQVIAFGDKEKDPLALIVGAKMKKMQGTPEELKAKKETKGTGSGDQADDKKAGGVDTNVEAVLARARELAGGNQGLLAMIKEVEGLQTKGQVRGPTTHYDAVLAGRTDVYRIVFEGDETAAVYVKGDYDTDLDLFVYDENHNYICSDEDYTDETLCVWEPDWTGPFRIEIKNLGRVRNRYVLRTN